MVIFRTRRYCIKLRPLLSRSSESDSNSKSEEWHEISEVDEFNKLVSVSASNVGFLLVIFVVFVKVGLTVECCCEGLGCTSEVESLLEEC